MPHSSSTPDVPRRRPNRSGRGGSDPAELSPVGRAIDAARRARGLSLLALSARLGISRQHLYRLLRSGDAPGGELRERLERLLDVRLGSDAPGG